MSNDPFDEFRKIEQMFRRALEGMDASFEGTGYSVSIKRIGGETKVNVSGDISEDDVKMLKRKYPNADITVNDQEPTDSGPVEVLEDEPGETGGAREGNEEGAEVEVVDEEEVEPSELALKRFEEKREEENSED